MPQDQWQGPERRQAHWPWQSVERRRQQSGYAETGVNAEQPKDEQEERDLAQARGPNPRVAK